MSKILSGRDRLEKQNQKRILFGIGTYKYFFLSMTISMLLSCKTAEQIQREQLLDNLATQMVQIQKLSSDQNIRLSEIENRLSRVSGNLEERQHSIKITEDTQTRKMKEDLELIKEQHESTLDQLKKNQAELEAQKQYLEKVFTALNKLDSSDAPKPKGKKGPTSAYDQAMDLYRSRQYAKALPHLTALLDDKKITGDRKARIYHNLGMSYYLTGKHESAVVSFSKLLNEHPKYSFNPNAMLHLGRSLAKLKQNDAAKEALQELIKRYPKSSHVQTAQNILKTLK